MPSILDYLRQPQGALSPRLEDPEGALAHQTQMQMLRKMNPQQLAAASLKEQEIQRRSDLLSQRPPIHYGGLPQGIQAQPAPGLAGFLKDKLGQWGQGVQGRAKEMAGALDPRAWPEAIRTLPNPATLMNQPMTPEQQKQIGVQGLNRALDMGPGGLGKLAGLAAHTVYHGSPHLFNKFDMSKIGTGEGAQAYGHGLYFAENPATALSYQKDLSNKIAVDGKPILDANKRVGSTGSPMIDDMLVANRGDLEKTITETQAELARARAGYPHAVPEIEKELAQLTALRGKVQASTGGSLYKVDIADEAIPKMLDWDKPLSADSPQAVQDAFNGLVKAYPQLKDKFFQAFRDKQPGSHYYSLLNDYAKTGDLVKNQTFASDALRQAGIPGIRYLDQGSRQSGGTSNFVLFDDSLAKILERQ